MMPVGPALLSLALAAGPSLLMVPANPASRATCEDLVEPLSNGGALDITVGEYFTPNGRNLGGGGVKQGAGISPDIYAVDNPHTHADEAMAVALATVAAEVK